MLIRAESIEVLKNSIVFDVAGVADIDMVRVGKHAHDFLFDGFRVVGEIDAVAERFAHFVFAVGAGEAAADVFIREDRVRFDEGGAVDGIESADDFAVLLEDGLLVFPNGDIFGIEGGNVGGLADRVSQKTDRDTFFEAAFFDFGFNGRVSLEPAERDQIKIIHSQFGELGDLGLDENDTFFGVDADRKIVESDLDEVSSDFFGVAGIVGQGLEVGDKNVELVFTGILELDTIFERADIVTEVEFAGRAIAS